jgi:hypothetical protein
VSRVKLTLDSPGLTPAHQRIALAPGGIRDMSEGALVCAIAPRLTKSGIARPHQNLGQGPGNFARIAPKKRPIIVKFYTLVEFIEAHILII